MSTRGLFVTGTDTGVGKTFVSALIARDLVADGVRVGAYKPACSGSSRDADGCEVWEDVDVLAAAIGGGFPTDKVCPQRYTAALAPNVAARMQNRTVDGTLLRDGIDWWNNRVDVLLVEGVGGLLCPLTDDETVADLANDLGFPLIIVASLGLGTINHTLLTVEVAANRGLRIAGIVLNQGSLDESDASLETNPQEIAARCDLPVLGVVARQQRTGLLHDGRPTKINWLAMADSHL